MQSQTPATLLGDYLPLLRSSRNELLTVIHLGSDGTVIARRIMEGSNPCSLTLPVRAIVGDALNLGTQHLILAHNHPSGLAVPSESDIASTRKLSALLGMLSVAIRDHLVVTREDMFSLADHDLIT